MATAALRVPRPGDRGVLAMVERTADTDEDLTDGARISTCSRQPAVGSAADPGRGLAELRRRADAVPAGAWLFSARLRRLGWLWLAITLPAVVAIGTMVHGEDAYVAWWVLVSGLFTTPALVNGWVLGRRVDEDQRSFWRWWEAGTASLYLVGVVLLAAVATGIDELHLVSGVFAVGATVAYSVALIRMMRERSGSRVLVVDVLESAMLTVAIVALAVPPLFDRIRTSEAAWFTIPSALTGICLVSSFCWALLLFRRLGGASRTLEALGAAVALVCIVDAGAQTAQGLSGFTLPSAPLFVLQAVCMGLVMMTPLHQPKVAPCGLDRLPPHAQVRGAAVAPVVVIALLGVLVVETVVLADTVAWAGGFLVAVVLVELVLLSARFQLASVETQRLYGRIRSAAEERRRLLTEIISSVDHDRHRVAARLHEQATSSYVAFVSYLQANGAEANAAGADGDPGPPGSLTAVREELAGQAEALRQLMLAIKPLEVAGPGPRRLTAPITAYLDSLYGDSPAPTLLVDIDPDVELDWTTETVAFRILQEALRNVWAHAGATHVRVALGVEDDHLALRVEDDGRGFDPDALLYESGLATMRSFAELHGGSLTVTSAPEQGTSVVARFGEGPGSADQRPRHQATTAGTHRASPAPLAGRPGLAAAPHLRLVDGPTPVTAVAPVPAT